MDVLWFRLSRKLDKNAPLARYDNMGLCWPLQGRFVTAIDENGATLSDGLRFYHRKPACERRSALLASQDQPGGGKSEAVCIASLNF